MPVSSDDGLQRCLEQLSMQLTLVKRASQQAVTAGDQAINMAAGLAQETHRLQAKLDSLDRENAKPPATGKVAASAPAFASVVPGPPEGPWLSNPGCVHEDSDTSTWWASGGLATGGLLGRPSPPSALQQISPPPHEEQIQRLEKTGKTADDDASTSDTPPAAVRGALVSSTKRVGKLVGHGTGISDRSSGNSEATNNSPTAHMVGSLKASNTLGTIACTERSTIAGAGTDDFTQSRNAGVLGATPLVPRGAQVSFEVLQIFIRESTTRIAAAPGSMLKLPSSITSGRSEETHADDLAIVALATGWLGRLQAFVIHPYDRRRVFWDVLSLFLVLYDSIVIPLQVLEPPENAFTQGMSWITRLFWTFDGPISCVSGFVCTNGNVELHPRLIIKRYAQTWMSLDLLVVSVDWIELVISNPGSGVSMARYGRVGRAIRLLRMIRLLRLLRMREVLSFLVERIQSETVVIGMNIVQIMMVISFTAHLMSCFWCVVGTLSSTPPWIVTTGYDALPLDIQYAVSLHWSLSQFTGGMDEVVPGMSNRGERIYAIVCWLLAFMFAAGFLSSLTSSMTQLYIITSADHDKLSALRRYLVQMDISKSLAARVRRNAQHAFSEQMRMVSEHNVELLRLVSEPLRMELHFEMFRPTLAQHPFFAHYIRECPQVMRRVCHAAVKVSLVSHGDTLFHTGEVPQRPKMYFVCTGELAYELDSATTGGAATAVLEHQWLAEAVLWTRWMHRGVLTVVRDSRICTVDAQAFHDIISQFEHQDFDPKQYAHEFVARLNGELSPSDLWTCPRERRSTI